MPKRRIVVLGWAWLPFQHMEGTGYNLVASELCAELAARGHEVTYLRSGHTYSLRRGMRIERGQVWRGVTCHDLINAPVVAPAHFGFRDPGVQCSHAEHTAMVLAFVRQARADIVHIHSLEGFALELVSAIRRARIATIVTPHNYYALCPQVDLMSRERETCLDYEGGRRCEGCIDRPPARDEIARRRSRHSVDRTLGPRFGMTMKTAMLRIAARAGVGSGRAQASDLAAPAPEAPEMPVSDPSTTDRLIAGREVHVATVNAYGQRRAAGVAALNAASLVLCPSRVLLEIHASMGVSRDRLRHVPLGLPHLDAMRSAAEASPFLDRTPWNVDQASRPLRLAYYGSTKPNKGLETLVRAIASLSPSVVARCHFDLFAPGDASPVRARLDAVAGARGRVRWFGAYEPRDLAASVGTYEVGLLPNMGLENSPLVLLEYLAAGAWVIASDLGASREWVRLGQNGTLFPAGDCAALASAIAAIVEGRVALPSVRSVHASVPFVSSAAYVADVEARHEEVLAGQPA